MHLRDRDAEDVSSLSALVSYLQIASQLARNSEEHFAALLSVFSDTMKMQWILSQVCVRVRVCVRSHTCLCVMFVMLCVCVCVCFSLLLSGLMLFELRDVIWWAIYAGS